MKNYDIPATCYFTLFSLSLDANRLDASNGLDDAACSRDVEEVVAAGLETCSATVCITHVRTAARSHTHRDQLSNASAAHFVREDEDPCKMTYSRMALIERGPSLLQTKGKCHASMRSNAASVHTTMQLRATSTTSNCTQRALELQGTASSIPKAAANGEGHNGTHDGGSGIHMKATAAGGAARCWRQQVEARRR